ncbi:HupE/UreJ family protein [Oharaeibacter diazotrophicus]|uniref:Urease accessory protein n=1 Tax=Oharaeibacter diazotrophicus TaxID=1920512 RepID=A0A4R6R9Z8_9HYPH|nr:HupE/UreJ family protein [Oharaeibacter diazotrophicus]TDP82456.1 urease accessory protein [Oharaeibacter diazotrophicus]BBE72781.1 HupE / UreJ protein [Pleomorphomonas sp. SM30]GLS76819.1 hypothetical protein GCM10007904_21560 [Oharaeibacter diazotrophicus]
MKPTLRLALSAALALAPTAALAHSGGAHVHSLAEGLTHPFLGVDHLAAMLGVGVVAARLGGRALIAAPMAFVAAMAAGAAIGAAGFGIPAVESLIALSLVLIGAVIAADRGLALPAVVGLVAAAGLVHGNAHGLEIPSAAAGLTYMTGALLASAALHGAGALAALRLRAAGLVVRGFGFATVAAGLVALAG